VHEERAKRPQWMLVVGREIIGPRFSVRPRVCVTRLENGNRGKIRWPGPTEKTTAVGLPQNHIGFHQG
jgi:hypothetical protein